ncbi:histidine kinase dimerization/phospho-acceptor domain-containing protein [Niallia sp. 03190]|uniref:histidine kinase dimerization/phospho-acceptor domain-containing protein n=1 Tax=Niallia sp. 03190 TaxID=3458061 RepID=UPI004043BF61
MATRWKNSITFVVWTLLFTIGVSGLITFCLFVDDYRHENYFDTTQFQESIYHFTEYLSNVDLYNIPEEKAKKAIKVTKDDINEHRYRYGTLDEQLANIKEQYKQRIGDAYAEENTKEAKALTEERDKKITDIKENFKSDAHIRPKVIKEKEAMLKNYYKEKELYYSEEDQANTEDFTYYFKNDKTGKVYTNMKPSEQQAGKHVINTNNTLFYTNYTITNDNVYDNYHSYDGSYGYIEYKFSDLVKNELIKAEQEGDFVGEIGISKSIDPSSSVMQDYRHYQQTKKILLLYSIACMAALIIAFIIGKKTRITTKASESCKRFYQKIPIDIRILFFITTIVCTGICIDGVTNALEYIFDTLFQEDVVIFLIMGTFCMGLTIIQGKLLFTVFKDWQQLKKEWSKALISKTISFIILLCKKTVHHIKEAFLNKSVGTQSFMILAANFGLGLLATLSVVEPDFIFIYILILIIIGFPLAMTLVKKIGYFNRIVLKTNELAAGKLGPDLEVSGKTVFAQLAGNMNVLTEAVKTSQSEQAKSERLKTELITNVSHDLRTPLTSIITYTQLLKSGSVTSEDQASYLEIIDRKSKRLKVLIDDLFEVSKMASGNIELKKEKVDVVQLLQQALAEYHEGINESTLQFRVTHKEKPVYAFVDGQKIWRVFENLIGNILKYSLEHSRVYISIEKLDNQAVITFKNISKYELSGNSEELHERFKRGDTSRHTEGSGLGLAIAKSIVELHDGIFTMETDGDLFKVSISLKEE